MTDAEKITLFDRLHSALRNNTSSLYIGGDRQICFWSEGHWNVVSKGAYVVRLTFAGALDELLPAQPVIVIGDDEDGQID